MNERLNRAAEARGLTVRFLTHRFRHSMATFMNNSGVDDLTISRTLGHSDAAFTRRQYMSFQEKQQKRSMQKLDAYLAGMWAE
ncbi:MAG: tyrosine-type recombinase/integrase [Clostridia bacterium]|nr:tyrosine-type recombinase/integrase [Clostridia bacterium]